MNAQLSAQDRLQIWLIHMGDALAAFLAALPKDIAEALDGTIPSLDVLEGWLLARYRKVGDAKPASEAEWVGGAARYVGEVFRQHTGSRWTVETRDPKFVFHGLPILVGGSIGPMPACPLTMVTTSLDRRTGRFLSGVVNNFVTPGKKP